MRNHKVEPRAPYFYLAFNIVEKVYELFLLIPVKENDKVHVINSDDLKHIKGKTMVDLVIEATRRDDEGDFEILKYVPLRLKLPFKKRKLPLHNGDHIEIIVKIKIGGRVISKKVMVFYKDSDNNYDGTESDKIAYNCPYKYLKKEVNVKQIKLYPFEFIPLKGYTIADQKLIITSSENGICESLITLKKSESNQVQIISDLIVNTEQAMYYDSRGLEGNFTTKILRFDDNEKASRFLKESPSRPISKIVKEIAEVLNGRKKKGKIRSGYASYLTPFSGNGGTPRQGITPEDED